MAVVDDPELLDIVMGVIAHGKNSEKIEKLLPDAKNFLRTGDPAKGGAAKKLETLIRERLETLNGTAAMVRLMGPGETYRECIENIEEPEQFESRFGVHPKEVETLLDYEVLPEHLLDIIVANSSKLLGDLANGESTINTLKQFQELEHIGTYRDMGITGKSSEAELWREKVAGLDWDRNTRFLSVSSGMGYEVTALLEAGVEVDQITIVDDSGFGTLWETAGFEYHNEDFLKDFVL
jgi:hypothetical protein